MKEIEITLADDEKTAINNVLVHHCMFMTDVLREQKSQEAFNSVMNLIQASIACQQEFFIFSAQQKVSLKESVASFIKPLMEAEVEKMSRLQEEMLKRGEIGAFEVTSAIAIVKNICLKLPNPSLIIAP